MDSTVECVDEQEDELELLTSMYPECDTSSDNEITSTVLMERMSRADRDDPKSINSLMFRVEVRGDGESLDLLSQLPLDVQEEQNDDTVVDGAAKPLPSPTAQEAAESAMMASRVLPANQRPELNRSVSGRRWLVTAKVVYLHPLTVYVDLPRDYPSVHPPSFSITALWLTQEQLAHVCHKLDELWEDQGPGTPILYTWIQWLETELFEFLDLIVCRTIRLIPALDQEEQCVNSEFDTRGVSQCSTDIMDAVLLMINYHREREAVVFTRTEQECEVCCDTKDGRHFFRLPECAHHFCHACMAEYISQHVREGTVQQISCPSSDCDGFISPDILKMTLGQEEYERWERLILQRTLEQLGDVAWCPRCGEACPCDRDDDSRLGECQTCHYCFCTDCEQTWHQGRCEDEARTRQGGFKKGEIKFLSMSSVKRCPGCRAPIEKNGGCNCVTCTVCRKSMCWRCGAAIKGLDHYQDNPACDVIPLLDPAVPRRKRQMEQVILLQELRQEGGGLTPLQCPACGSKNLKEGRNNHVCCYFCRAQLCYVCKQRIQGQVTAHFQLPGLCRQHTDD